MALDPQRAEGDHVDEARPRLLNRLGSRVSANSLSESTIDQLLAVYAEAARRAPDPRGRAVPTRRPAEKPPAYPRFAS